MTDRVALNTRLYDPVRRHGLSYETMTDRVVLNTRLNDPGQDRESETG